MSRFRDLTGLTYGTLLVLRLSPRRRRGSTRWECRCSCGREVTLGVGDLKVAISCGCTRPGRQLALAGVRFGRLVAVARLPGKRSAWLCRCDCGAERTVLTGNLARGRTLSCGCLNAEKRRRHGLTGTREIGRWYAAQRRARLRAAGGAHTPSQVRDLWDRQQGCCAACGANLTAVPAELDHIVALSRGGSNSIENLQWLCKRCNRSKHARLTVPER